MSDFDSREAQHDSEDLEELIASDEEEDGEDGEGEEEAGENYSENESSEDEYPDQKLHVPDPSVREIFRLTSRLAEISRGRSGKSVSKRLNLFPLEDFPAYQRAKVMESSFWTAQEIHFEHDVAHFEALPEAEREILLRTFGFFAVADGSVIETLAYRLIVLARTPEQRLFYIKQLDNETVHAETYGLMIEHLVGDKKKAAEVRNYAETVKSIKRMTGYLDDLIDNCSDERTAYVTLTIGEYLLFSPLFAIIFWFRAFRKGKLLNIIFSNEQIAKDEGQHCLNGCAMYRELPEMEQFSDEEIHGLIDRVVRLMDDFVVETLSDCRVPNFEIPKFKQYIRYVADDLLHVLKHAPLYRIEENPLIWMSFMHFRNKTNFYEGSVGEYQRGNVKKALETARAISEDRLGALHAPLFSEEIGF
jgi:ribonucleotide reductase beta subunit family protein with ferritin-like domain